MDGIKVQESVLLEMLSVGSMPLPITNIAYDANNNAEYIGVAMQGDADDDATWRIEKMTWESDGAGGYRYLSSRFSKAGVKWSERAAGEYT